MDFLLSIAFPRLLLIQHDIWSNLNLIRATPLSPRKWGTSISLLTETWDSPFSETTSSSPTSAASRECSYTVQLQTLAFLFEEPSAPRGTHPWCFLSVRLVGPRLISVYTRAGACNRSLAYCLQAFCLCWCLRRISTWNNGAFAPKDFGLFIKLSFSYSPRCQVPWILFRPLVKGALIVSYLV